MYDAVIEINDIDLPVWHAGALSHAPAFALLQEGGLSFGQDAQQQARLHPLKINNRFVQQLSLVETPELKPYARHHADLAYRFLQYVHQQSGQPERCVFAVPPTYSEQHMAVLLGVVKPCEFDAVGLVDQAALLAAEHASQSSGVFCDLQLHQLALGSYRIDNGEVIREASHGIEQLGLLALYERWIRVIANAFIEQCRYDPLHDAEVEQLLWSQLPGIIEQQGQSELFHVDLLNKYQARIQRADMLAPVDDLYQQLGERLANLAPDAEQLLFSHRLAHLPGLADRDARIHRLPANAVFDAVAKHQQRICSNAEQLPFISRLPHQKPGPQPRLASSASAPQSGTAKTTISHFLIDHTAHPLNGRPLHLNALGAGIVWSHNPGSVALAVVRQQGPQWLLENCGQQPLWHNGTARSDASFALARGDSLQLSEGGACIAFIEVQDAGDTG